jgi:hypothetical protein
VSKHRYAEPADANTGNGWTVWVRPIHGIGDRNYRISCCDCHLIHEMQFRVYTDGYGQPSVKFRVRRNQRATNASRRGKTRYVVKTQGGVSHVYRIDPKGVARAKFVYSGDKP